MYLRVGDVFDWPAVYPCARIVLRESRSCAYASAVSAFRPLLRLDVPEALIVASPLYRASTIGHNGSESRRYVDAVATLLRERLRVTVLLDRDADCDLLTLAGATHLATYRRGKFALLAQKMAWRLGGHVYQLS